MRNCPICDSSNKKVLYTQKFGIGIAPIDSYNVVYCEDCGMCYANNIPCQEDFNTYYKTMSKYETIEYPEQYMAIFNLLKHYCKDKDISILDVGCSNGALLSIFKDNGYENIMGVDPSLACINKVRKKGIAGICGSLEDIIKLRFDVIILSAVLEHISDISSFMVALKSKLKPRGLLFIEVPNAAQFERYVCTPFQQFSIEHINYFSLWSLDNLLRKYNLEKIKIEKGINKASGVSDPSIMILAINNDFTIKKDDVTALSLMYYIKESSNKIELIKERINNAIKDKDCFIIWGVGTFTQVLIGNGLDISKVSFFVDSNINYHGKYLNDKPIKLPIEITNKNIPILIISQRRESILEQMIEMNINNEVYIV